MSTRPRLHRDPSGWIETAGLGLAAWFFGNLYESAVDLPTVLAERDKTRLWDPGSPVRYYSPAVPPALATTGIALWKLWRGGARPSLVAAAAAGPATALGLTAYLVPAINHRLQGEPLDPPQRHHAVATWQRVNALRLVALAGGALALRRAAHQPRSAPHSTTIHT